MEEDFFFVSLVATEAVVLAFFATGFALFLLATLADERDAALAFFGVAFRALLFFAAEDLVFAFEVAFLALAFFFAARAGVLLRLFGTLGNTFRTRSRSAFQLPP